MVRIEKNTSFFCHDEVSISNNCQIIGKFFVSKIIFAIFAVMKPKNLFIRHLTLRHIIEYVTY